MLEDMLRCLLITAFFPLASLAQTEKEEVDLELVLMVDVSRSMTERELEIQRRGYAEALRTDAVLTALRSGLLRKVAMVYVEWAGTQQIIVDWRLLENGDDLEAFANALTVVFDPSLRRTSISGALGFAADAIRNNRFEGIRKVIDISGDGPNNQGALIVPTRDEVLAEGIVINGLPLMTKEGMGSDWHLDRLDVYYETCVIGGPGSFVIPVHDWDDFADAVRQKLVLEMVDRPNLLSRVQFIEKDPSDCEIGEKIWRDRMQYWGEP